MPMCMCQTASMPKLSRTRSSHTALSALEVILHLAERGDQVGQTTSHVHCILPAPRSPLRSCYPVSSYSKRCTQVVKPGSPHHVAAYVTPAELAMWPQLNRFANEIRCMRVYMYAHETYMHEHWFMHTYPCTYRCISPWHVCCTHACIHI